MNYRINIAITARMDIQEATRWIRDHVSPTAANRWLAKLTKVVESLGDQPLRCPLADESGRFPEEIRQLLFGKRSKKYRILFTVRGDTVVILYIRHSARDEIEP